MMKHCIRLISRNCFAGKCGPVSKLQEIPSFVTSSTSLTTPVATEVHQIQLGIHGGKLYSRGYEAVTFYLLAQQAWRNRVPTTRTARGNAGSRTTSKSQSWMSMYDHHVSPSHHHVQWKKPKNHQPQNPNLRCRSALAQHRWNHHARTRKAQSKSHGTHVNSKAVGGFSCKYVISYNLVYLLWNL